MGKSASISNDEFIKQPEKGATLSEDLRELLTEAADNRASEGFVTDSFDRPVLNSPVPEITDQSRSLEIAQANAVLSNPKAERSQKTHYAQLRAALVESNESAPSMTYIDGRRQEIPASTRDSANAMDPPNRDGLGPKSSKLLKVLLGDDLYKRTREWARKANVRRTAMFLGPELYALLRSDAAFDLPADIKERFEREDNEDSSDINQAVAKLFGMETMMEARRLARFNKCSVHNIITAFTLLVLQHREKKLQESLTMISGEEDL